MGPVLTEAAGVPSESIGILASIGSAGTMWFLVAGGDLLARLGAVRILQVGALVAAAGVAIALSGGWWALVAASLLIGLGYGPSPPAGSDILKRYAPARHRSLVFSIKQSGVPLGGAVAAIVIPARRPRPPPSSLFSATSSVRARSASSWRWAGPTRKPSSLPPWRR